VPPEDVAGVSIGTLYNRFPTRGALVDATLAGKVAETVEYAQAADPWTGFAWFLEHSCAPTSTR
jgi:AcrR family transcriptional regulator